MSTIFRTDAGGLWTEQAVGSDLDYSLDWADALDPADTIAASSWTATAGVVLDQASFTASTTTTWVSGGIGGKWYELRNTATTGTGRVHVRTFRIYVRGALPAGTTLFPDPIAALGAMRRDRLAGPAQAWMAGVVLSDEYLLSKLLAAEKMVERRLRMFLTPVEILPQAASQEERDALTLAGTRWAEEPGYDADPRTIGARGSWGAIELRHIPVQAVHSVRFTSLGLADGPYFDVPANWIRMDKKYGRLQFVPIVISGGVAFSGLMLGAFGSGRTMPLAIQVRYRAGLVDAAVLAPDLLGLIQRLAILDVLDDQFLASSGSTSVDGLSQSASWDSGKHREGAEAALDRLSASLQGIRLVVL